MVDQQRNIRHFGLTQPLPVNDVREVLVDDLRERLAVLRQRLPIREGSREQGLDGALVRCFGDHLLPLLVEEF